MVQCNVRCRAVSQRSLPAHRCKVIDSVSRFVFGMRFEGTIDRGGREKCVGNAGVQPACAEWSKHMTRFAGEQNSSIGVCEDIRNRLPEDVRRNPGYAVRVIGSHDRRKPFANAVSAAECFRNISGMALQIDPPVSRKWNEQDVAAARTRMLVMEYALNRQWIGSILGSVNDDECIRGVGTFEL